MLLQSMLLNGVTPLISVSVSVSKNFLAEAIRTIVSAKTQYVFGQIVLRFLQCSRSFRCFHFFLFLCYHELGSSVFSLKIELLRKYQFPKIVQFRRFEKTRNGGIIIDVLKNGLIYASFQSSLQNNPKIGNLATLKRIRFLTFQSANSVSLTSRAISAAKLNVRLLWF